MTQIDWNRKLTSRKWWLAVTAFIVGIVGMFNESFTEQVGGIVLLVADVVTYTLAEAYIDAEKGDNNGTNL